jgi:diadenosine tetraphosphate (Ap4A) HIT family hydrolase
VSEGHTLVVPKKEVADLFELEDEEYHSCFDLVKQVRKMLIDVYKPQGFNVGINNSPVAGQTVPHAHIHVIPRYEGDVKNPRGGIRNIIPEKGDY